MVAGAKRAELFPEYGAWMSMTFRGPTQFREREGNTKVAVYTTALCRGERAPGASWRAT